MTQIHHRIYTTWREDYDRIRDALAGQRAMRKNASLYLRQPAGLSSVEWTNYVNGAHFYPVAYNTLQAMMGLAFRKDPTFTVPTRLEPMLKEASFDGEPIKAVCEALTREVLSLGRVCAVLDFPVDGTTSLSTPYIATYEAETILDWKQGLVGGVRRLTHLRLCEQDDDLEDTGVELHVVYTLEPALTVRRYHVTTTRDGKTSEVQVGEDLIPSINGTPLFYVPAVIMGALDIEPDVEKPPLLDLVDVNVAHFANSADLEHALHMSAMPTPVITGNLSEDQKPSAIGPGALWVLPENAKAFFLAAPSDAHASLRTALEDKENRMAALGARMIHSGARRNEAADTARMRYSNETAILLSSLYQVEAAIRTLLSWARDWVQADGDVLVSFNTDLVSDAVDAATITALMKATQAGLMSRASFIDALREGEIVKRTVEEELDLIEEDGGNLMPLPSGLA